MWAAPPLARDLARHPADEAERYRAGAEAFLDRLFFQEEVEECLRFLDEAIRA